MRVIDCRDAMFLAASAQQSIGQGRWLPEHSRAGGSAMPFPENGEKTLTRIGCFRKGTRNRAQTSPELVIFILADSALVAE
jgi:hypothetical protein